MKGRRRGRLCYNATDRGDGPFEPPYICPVIVIRRRNMHVNGKMSAKSVSLKCKLQLVPAISQPTIIYNMHNPVQFPWMSLSLQALLQGIGSFGQASRRNFRQFLTGPVTTGFGLQKPNPV